MKSFILISIVLSLTSMQINAQYGDYGVKEEEYKDEKLGGGYGKGFIGKEFIPVKEVGLKPGVVKPPFIPFVKPILKSYQKFPQFGHHYGGYGGGYGGGHGGGYGGGYGHGGGYAGYGGKLIPISKLHEYQPKFDINPFIKPYEGAKYLQKFGKEPEIIKEAKPVFITQPAIEKTIFQRVYVKQPVLIKEQPVIYKEKEIVVKKKPAIVKINEKAPVDVKDFGQTAVVKGVGVVKEPVYEKEVGIGKGGEYGGGYGGEKLE